MQNLRKTKFKNNCLGSYKRYTYGNLWPFEGKVPEGVTTDLGLVKIFPHFMIDTIIQNFYTFLGEVPDFPNFC